MLTTDVRFAGHQSAFHVNTDLIASQFAGGHHQLFDIDHGTCKSIFVQEVRRGLGLALHRGWAKLMLDRYRDLVQRPNQPRPTAAEATDENDEEENVLYHYTHPPGYGG